MSDIQRQNVLSLLLGLLLIPAMSFSQLGAPEDIVRISPKWSQSAAMTGGSVQLALQITIEEPWHINSNAPLDEFLIPTQVTFQTPEGVTTGRVYYPEPHLYNFEFSESDVAVYQGTVNLVSSVSVDEAVTGDNISIHGTLTYQACNNTSCLPPRDLDFSTTIPIASGQEEVEEVNTAIFSTVGSGSQGIGSGAQAAQESQIAAWISEKGMLLTLLLIFVGGLALNLTPCVYPLIPITISYFGGQARGSNVKSTFTLAVFYVLGMAITYSLLGTVAALTGQMIGAALQNPFVLGFIAIILVALASSMFGAFEIRVPQSLASIGGKSRQGVVGSLFMGLTVGIIAAPCIGPFVLSLLIFVGDLGNPFLGFLMFFTLSLGLGLPFLLLGTFSGLMQKLPQSGQWMVWVRYIFGFVLIGMAIYFLEPLFSPTLYKILLAVDAFAAAVFLGLVTRKKSDTGIFKVVKPVVGMLFMAIGFWIVMPAQAETESVEWSQYSEEQLQQSTQSDTPVIIDFYADWCIPCKELDQFTFSDQQVMQAAGEFTMLKADLTKNNVPEVQKLKQEYDIRGVPTIVFINNNGQEIRSLRLTGFESPEKFLQRMEKVSS